MHNNELLKKVRTLGFPLLDVDEVPDVDKTLAEVVASRDVRLREGFPVVLANSAERGLFHYDEVSRHCRTSSDKAHFASLAALSLALYTCSHLKFSWTDSVYQSLPDPNKKEVSAFAGKLANDEEFQCAGQRMSSQRLKSAFRNYYQQTQKKLGDMLSLKNEMNLEYALSQVFSPKQKELFFKKIKREKLTKTEKEYFSRVVKKKVMALAHPDLHRFAQMLLE